MNKKLVLLGTALLLCAGPASAQKRVTGRVIDSAGHPVEGASVRVEGGKGIAVTDEKGNFTLKDVPASAKLLKVSYFGMQTATVSVAADVKVVLKENQLGEAVVIGYGTGQKVGTVVGSVKKVGGEVVNNASTPTLTDALQGQVAGLQILQNTGDIGDLSAESVASINIRGIGSLSADNVPLIVVDGSPVSQSIFSMMNDNDIESVTVLKDASATSIYGSRAANGVIYITTKKGRRGEKAQVTLSQKIGWSQLASGIGNPMSASELLDFQLENGIIGAAEYAEYKAHGANTNWQDYHFDNAAPLYSTDFSVRGGSENTSYFVSASYLKQKGLTTDKFKRYTLRSNLDSKVKDWMTIGLNQSVTYTDRARDGYTYSGNGNIRDYATAAYMYPAYWDPYDPEYAAEHLIYGMNSYDTKYLNDLQPSQTNDIVYNGTGFVELTPIKGLTVRSQLGLYAVDTRNSSQILPGFPGQSSGTARESHSRFSLWTITNTAEYKFKIGESHEFTLLAGQEGIKGSSKSFGATGTGTTDVRLPSLGNITTANLPTYSSYKYEYLSFFGRIDYAMKNKYFANVTVRNDQSSRFGRDNRGATFVSAGVMWDIAAEDFMLPTRGWLSDLKVKASIGSTGNSEIGNYRHLGLIGTTQYGGTSGWVMSQPSNPLLGWEKQVQTNVGFAATFFDRLTLDFNWYNRMTKDMLMKTPLPYTTGFEAQMTNVGEMSNKGIEIEVSYDIIRTKDAFLNVRATYAYNSNKIEKLFHDLNEWPMLPNLTNYIVGKSLNYYMPIYAGVDKEDGAPMWYKKGFSGDAGYVYNPETMTKEFDKDKLSQDTGKKLFAPHNGGFGFSAGWKGLTLNADFSFVLGKYMVNNERMFSCSAGNATAGFNQDKDMLHIWKKPGDLAELPGFQYDTQFDTHLLENASFLRLKNLSVSYDLPKQLIEATRVLSGVRVNFTTRNLFTVTKWKGADPETDSNISYGVYPATRQFTFGIDVTF